MWYVVQTLKGQETKILDGIHQYVKEDTEDAFIMWNEKMYKHKGKWEADMTNLFPGYLFVVTKEPMEFDRRLHKKYPARKLLRVDDKITAIQKNEEEFLKALGGDEHIVRFSKGFREGDQIIVESGALKDKTGIIKKLDRHNRQAIVSLSLFGRKTDITLGLEIVKSL